MERGRSCQLFKKSITSSSDHATPWIERVFSFLSIGVRICLSGQTCSVEFETKA